MIKKVATRKRNKESSKARIIDAAIVVFAKNGYDKATYKAISEISGLNESLITRYFGSKKGLAIATVKHIKDQCFYLIRSAEPKPTFAQEFHAIGTAMTELYKRNVNDIVTLFLLLPVDDSLADVASKENLLKIPDDGRLKIFQNKGEIPDNVDLEKLMKQMIMLIHSVLYFVFLALKLPIKEAERFLHYNIDSFIFGLTKENRSLFDLVNKQKEPKMAVERRRRPREI